MKPKIERSENEWKEKLNAEEYRVLREKGTELAFTGEYVNHKGNGVYTCRACGNPLFKSEAKYDSGSGWPAFYDVIEGALTYHTDESFGMIRTEITCAGCGSHQGHVFNDGPNPTGKRYCVNSISMKFEGK